MGISSFCLIKRGFGPVLSMNIYLQHPVHGRKVATMELEAVFDETNGWTRYNPDMPSEPEEAVNALEVKRKYTRRAVAEGV
jgi:hypothetical protein